MQQSGANIQAISPFNISPSDTIRWKPWGAASDLSPNPIDGSAAASNTEIIAINNSVRGLRVEAEIIAQKGDSVRVALPLETVAKELADVISRLLLAAKGKMPNKTLVQDGTKVFDSGELLRELRQSNFTVFVTGGGAHSGWYLAVVDSVHQERDLFRFN